MTIAAKSDDRSPVKRAFCTHQPKWQRFQPTLLKPVETKKAEAKDRETYQYQRQYSHVYYHRLVALKGRCWKVLTESDEKGSTKTEFTKIHRVLELREDVPSRIVGTLVKETIDSKEDPLQPDTNCRPSDQLFLEDESGRVALQVENVHHYCTGLVAGVEGAVDSNGTLQVQRIVFPKPPSQPDLASSGRLVPSMAGDESGPSPHVLLVSSLLCGDPNVPSLPREMLLSYLQGQFTDDAAKVCRVLLVGGGPSHQDPLFGIKELDAFALQLSRAGIPVDVLPGKDDPTTANWPQRPLHSSLLPHATAIVSRTPNPYMAALGPQLVVATDGENVRDLQKHILSSQDKLERCSELEALQRTLEWSHLCPTGPDSIPTVPHMEDDPMVVDQMPHLYVCGSASEFATTTISSASDQTTTLVCVPQFHKTGEAVLVNLETRNVELLRFEDSE